jgi:hypothetical protein
MPDSTIEFRQCLSYRTLTKDGLSHEGTQFEGIGYIATSTEGIDNITKRIEDIGYLDTGTEGIGYIATAGNRILLFYRGFSTRFECTSHEFLKCTSPI